MPTKTKITSNSRGRPKKEFKLAPKSVDDKKRSRGRPKKDKSIKATDSINTRISKHDKDIKKLSKNHTKICMEIKNNTFSSKKIEDDPNTGSDKFALGLLVFSMLLFIFSLYKTFYLNPNTVDENTAVFSGLNNVVTENIDKVNVAKIEDKKNINNEKEEIILKDTIKEKENITANIEWSTIKSEDVIKSFYAKINSKNYWELKNFGDYYMKKGSLFRLYYTENWLWNFLDNITNEKIYLTNIQEIKKDVEKVGVKYYQYTIKYKLKNKNEMFEEIWETVILDKDGEKLIGSLRCTNTGCSKLPFFNPEKYGIK